MSYAEYLRRKADSSQKVLDYQPKKVDASQFITQKRLLNSTVFSVGGRNKGVVTVVSDPSTTGTAVTSKALQSTVKQSGGSVADASVFTAYAGGNAVNEDLRQGARNTKYVVPANLPAQLCTSAFLNGPAAAKSAGDWSRSNAPCTNGRQPHTETEVGPALFVDTKPRLCATANHTHPANVPHTTRWAPRPQHGMGGIPVTSVSSPSDARKVGDFAPRNIPYVEKHHGNDLAVNPRRIPGRFVPTIRAPAHLKINDPRHYPVV